MAAAVTSSTPRTTSGAPRGPPCVSADMHRLSYSWRSSPDRQARRADARSAGQHQAAPLNPAEWADDTGWQRFPNTQQPVWIVDHSGGPAHILYAALFAGLHVDKYFASSAFSAAQQAVFARVVANLCDHFPDRVGPQLLRDCYWRDVSITPPPRGVVVIEVDAHRQLSFQWPSVWPMRSQGIQIAGGLTPVAVAGGVRPQRIAWNAAVLGLPEGLGYWHAINASIACPPTSSTPFPFQPAVWSSSAPAPAEVQVGLFTAWLHRGLLETTAAVSPAEIREAQTMFLQELRLNVQTWVWMLKILKSHSSLEPQQTAQQHTSASETDIPALSPTPQPSQTSHILQPQAQAAPPPRTTYSKGRTRAVLWQPREPDSESVAPDLLRRDPNDYKYRQLGNVCTDDWQPSWDATADDAGHNAQAENFLCPSRPLQLHWRSLVGTCFVCNPPYDSIEDLLPFLLQAVAQDPSSTRGTVILPERRTAKWFYRYVARRNAPLRVIHRHPAGQRIFTFPAAQGRRRPAGPTKEPIIVCRLGATPQELATKCQEYGDAVAPSTLPEAPSPVPVSSSSAWSAGLQYLESIDATEFTANCIPQQDGHEDPLPLDEWQQLRTECMQLLRHSPLAQQLTEESPIGTQWHAGTIAPSLAPSQWFVHERRAGQHKSRLNPAPWREFRARYGSRLGPVYMEALDLIENDVTFPMAFTPGWQDYGHHGSVELYKDRIGKEVQFYQEAGIWEYWDGKTELFDFAAFLNQMLVVVRFPDDGKGRLCINLTKSGVTEACVCRPFRLSSPKDHLRRTRSHYILARTDMAKAFFHHLVHARSRRFLAFRCPLTGRIARFVAPPFGLAASPEFLYILAQALVALARLLLADICDELMRSGQVAEEVIRELRAAIDTLDPFADDFVYQGAPIAFAVMNWFLHTVGTILGFRFDPPKDVFGRAITILGAGLSARNLTMRIGPVKAKAYLQGMLEARQRWQKTNTASVADLHTWRGRIGFLAQLSRWLGFTLGPIQSALMAALKQKRMPQLREEFWLVWDFLIAALQPANEHWLITSQWAVLPPAEQSTTQVSVSTTDASGREGGGIISAKGNLRLRYEEDTLDAHITYKELIVAVRAVQQQAAAWHQQGIRHILIECDNKAAVAIINKAAFKDARALRAVLELAACALTHRLDVRAVHRPGTFMKRVGVDALTRDELHRQARVAATWISPASAFRTSSVPASRQDTRRQIAQQLQRAGDVEPNPGPSMKLRRSIIPICAVCSSQVKPGAGLRCLSCGLTAHQHCISVGFSKRGTYTCGTCLLAAAASPDQGRFGFKLHTAARFYTNTIEASSADTYSDALRRFVSVVQSQAVAEGLCLSGADILPPDPLQPTPVELVLVFIEGAADIQKYAFQTIASTLSAVADWHKRKSLGRLVSPTHHPLVEAIHRGMRVTLAGTSQALPQAKLAMPREYWHALLALVQELHDTSTRPLDRYCYARDLLWYVLSYIGCLRPGETLPLTTQHIRFDDQHARVYLWLEHTKNHKSGITMCIARELACGVDLRHVLQQLRIARKAVGAPDSAPFFGQHYHPARPLTTIDSFIRRLNQVYVPLLVERGLRHPQGIKWAGYAFRRGGINAIRDVARKAGVGGDELSRLLLAYGRWKNPKSMEKYLVPTFGEIAELTSLV